MTEDIDRHIGSRAGVRELLEGDLRAAMIANAEAADQIVELEQKLALAVAACRIAIEAFGGGVVDSPITERQAGELRAMLHLTAVVEDNP